MKFLASFAFFLALASLVHAQALEWDQAIIPLDVPTGSTEKISGEFHFTNTSDHPVQIKKIPASCFCIVSKPAKTTYAPGESGSIPFTYSPKKSWGTRAYRLFVVTNEPKSKPYQLAIHITEHDPKAATIN